MPHDGIIAYKSYLVQGSQGHPYRGNYKISCVDNTPHLTILKADKADSGRYSCHASNDIGKDSCSTEVSVKGIWSLLFGVTMSSLSLLS